MHSYPSIFNLGHRAVRELLTDPVVVEEKIDGSQFSFGVFPLSEDLEPLGAKPEGPDAEAGEAKAAETA